MTTPTAERPLVTFALFAYNQEQYIREAVEGAFSQTYEPLEILLSDDCSSDRTFEIIEEMATAYEGPHRVTARRNRLNVGIGAHVSSVFHMSAGAIVVVAAGDDLSLPHRTEAIADYLLRNPKTLGCCSNVVSFGGQTLTITPPREPRELLSRDRCIKGASAAYQKCLITKFPPLKAGAHHEDDILCLRALLVGDGFGHVEEALVKYRENVGVSASFNSPKDSNSTRQRSIREIENRMQLFLQWKADLEYVNRPDLLPLTDFHLAYYTLLHNIVKRNTSVSDIAAAFKALGAKCVFYELARYRAQPALSFYIWAKEWWTNDRF